MDGWMDGRTWEFGSEKEHGIGFIREERMSGSGLEQVKLKG